MNNIISSSWDCHPNLSSVNNLIIALKWTVLNFYLSSQTRCFTFLTLSLCFMFCKIWIENLQPYLYFRQSVSSLYMLYLEPIVSAWTGVLRHNKPIIKSMTDVSAESSNSSSPSTTLISITPEDKKTLVSLLSLYFALTVASDSKKLVRRATSTMAPLWSYEECVSAFVEVT